MSAAEAMQTQLDPPAAEPADGFEMGVLLRTAYFSLRRCGNTHFGPFGANGDQFVLLKLLADSGPMNQLDLVKRGGYDPSTTTNMLKLLQTRGLIAREPDPNDGRAKIVRLTPSGRDQHRKLWEVSRPVQRKLWKAIRPRDRTVIVETLRRIIQDMDSARRELETNIEQ